MLPNKQSIFVYVLKLETELKENNLYEQDWGRILFIHLSRLSKKKNSWLHLEIIYPKINPKEKLENWKR